MTSADVGSRLPSGKEKVIHAQSAKQKSFTNKRAVSSSSCSTLTSVADLEGVASSKPLQVCLYLCTHMFGLSTRDTARGPIPL